MVLNLFINKFKHGFMNMELFTNVVVSRPPNKIALLNISIDIYLINLPLSFWDECILTASFLINKFLLLFLNINHLTKFYFELFLHTYLFEFLDVYGLLKICTFNINLMKEVNLEFLLVIHMVKRDITYMISKLIKSMFLMMLNSMSQFFHIAIFNLHHLTIPLILLPFMMMELLTIFHQLCLLVFLLMILLVILYNQSLIT